MDCKLIVALSTILILFSTAGPVRAETAPHLGYGMMLAYPPGHLHHVTAAGFDWFKYFVDWDVVDANQDRIYNWETVDWRLNEACEHELNVLLRVERSPTDWTPIRDAEMAGWEAFFEDLAAHIADRRAACATPYRVALEVWNEPNLDFQWGYRPVDPARYTEMVNRAYRGAKAGDPQILVIAGSLAPTGGTGDGRAMNDVTFLEAMYAAGLKGHFDAISIHNYGFGGAPEDKVYGSGILNFRRAEDIHSVMVAHGDGHLPVWGTEFGWLLASGACSGYWESIGFGWQQVTAEQQADYLQRAFAYADTAWPWMEVMIVSNLDFDTLPWYAECDPLRGFSIFNRVGSPRPAYTALAEMHKRPRAWLTAEMTLMPAVLSWMQPVSATRIVSASVTVQNTGDLAFAWGATAVPAAFLVDVTPASGQAGDAFTVTVDPRDLPVGQYTAVITVTATVPDMQEGSQSIPLTVSIVEHLNRTYLPTVRRDS